MTCTVTYFDQNSFFSVEEVIDLLQPTAGTVPLLQSVFVKEFIFKEISPTARHNTACEGSAFCVEKSQHPSCVLLPSSHFLTVSSQGLYEYIYRIL
jgi:hypothetical protein